MLPDIFVPISFPRATPALQAYDPRRASRAEKARISLGRMGGSSNWLEWNCPRLPFPTSSRPLLDRGRLTQRATRAASRGMVTQVLVLLTWAEAPTGFSSRSWPGRAQPGSAHLSGWEWHCQEASAGRTGGAARPRPTAIRAGSPAGPPRPRTR